MPAVVVSDHGYRHIAEFRFPGQLGFLQVGHADHVHAQVAVNVRLRFRGKLRTIHAEISAARLAHHTRFLAGGFDDTRQFPTDGLAEGDVRHHAVSKKSIYPVTRAVEELIRDHEL